MPKEWTDEEVKAEIASAVAIYQEDREKAEYTRLHGKYGNGEPPKNDGGAPPKKDPPKDPDPPAAKKRGLWWGESDE